jgi:hypothetical protein
MSNQFDENLFSGIITIDGIDYSIGVVKISRKANVFDKYAKRTVDGDLHREIIGVYYNYEIEFGSFWDMEQYDKLYDKLTEPQEFHIISVPTNKGIRTFKGYIAEVEDEIEYVENNNRIIKGLKCSFISKVPSRTPRNPSRP